MTRGVSAIEDRTSTTTESSGAFSSGIPRSRQFRGDFLESGVTPIFSSLTFTANFDQNLLFLGRKIKAIDTSSTSQVNLYNNLFSWPQWPHILYIELRKFGLSSPILSCFSCDSQSRMSEYSEIASTQRWFGLKYIHDLVGIPYFHIWKAELIYRNLA